MNKDTAAIREIQTLAEKAISNDCQQYGLNMLKLTAIMKDDANARTVRNMAADILKMLLKLGEETFDLPASECIPAAQPAASR